MTLEDEIGKFDFEMTEVFAVFAFPFLEKDSGLLKQWKELKESILADRQRLEDENKAEVKSREFWHSEFHKKMSELAEKDKEIDKWKEEYGKALDRVAKLEREIERLNDKLTRWKVPKDEFSYIGKCKHCGRPCLEIEQESTGLCTCCESLKKPTTLTAEDVFSKLKHKRSWHMHPNRNETIGLMDELKRLEALGKKEGTA